ncbi:MAG: outer membrane protein assembly factor BamB [Janthinobacterium lividum]
MARWSRSFCLVMMGALLAACSATKDPRRTPVPLVDFKPVLEVKQAWTASVGKSKGYLFEPIAVAGAIYAAGANGTVAKFDVTTGQTIWHNKLDADLSAGVGSDGTTSAVGALDGTVYALGSDGKMLWKADAGGEVLAPPLVGQGFVLVRTIDGRISAFDSTTGERKWEFRARQMPLNLRTTTGMTFAGSGAILAGFPGGSLAAINLQTGDAYWQTPVSFPQGVTEVERLNDVTGAPTLVGRTTCAVTFQGRIGCFSVESGQPLWQQPFSSYGGLAQDEQTVVSANDYSNIALYDVATGNKIWQNDRLKSRDVSAPLLLGRAIVVGDYQGYVHFLSRETGDFIARMKTDGSAIVAPPVVAGQTLVVLTRDGELYAFQPQ